MIKVIAYENNSLRLEQIKILNEKFGKNNWELFPVHSSKMSVEKQKELANKIISDKNISGIVFLDLVPILFGELCSSMGFASCCIECNIKTKIMDIFIFYEDTDKKEWQLVRIV